MEDRRPSNGEAERKRAGATFHKTAAAGIARGKLAAEAREREREKGGRQGENLEVSEQARERARERERKERKRNKERGALIELKARDREFPATGAVLKCVFVQAGR